MTFAERREPTARDLISVAEFRSWLARPESCSWFEYHRGMLIWDRSPASELSDDHRRALARIANAALQAAEDGLVDLVQRRHGEFDFGYLAVKRGQRFAAAAAVPSVQPLGAAA